MANAQQSRPQQDGAVSCGTSETSHMLLSHGSWMIRMLAPVGTVPTTTGVGDAANGISASGTNLAVDLAAGFTVT